MAMDDMVSECVTALAGLLAGAVLRDVLMRAAKIVLKDQLSINGHKEELEEAKSRRRTPTKRTVKVPGDRKRQVRRGKGK